MSDKFYLCIDLKSFYASIECVERGLNPMTTNLVVADMERTDKTICLAITPAMKQLGISNRCRVFEIPSNVPYIVAPPRMKRYIEYAAEIYAIYLQYISKDDIYVYSIDEAFLDVTNYLSLYHTDALSLGRRIMNNIYQSLGIPASCGAGTNLYLTKIALDITAKHSPDFTGFLDEHTYRSSLWSHTPLTDFWRIGNGIAKKLHSLGIYTMKDIAHADENLLYSAFGIDAELLIDHAWGIEPTTIKDIKCYKPQNHSITSGQVLMHDYNFEDGKLIIKEMADLICLELLSQNLITGSITLHVGYSNRFNVAPAHGTTTLDMETNSDFIIIPALSCLYEDIVNPNLSIIRINITCNNVKPEEYLQYPFFVDIEKLEKNRQLQKAVLEIKNKYGKNAVLKGMNLQENAMTIERNKQIGGHKSGE
ncbi:MAG: DNA repair protein [Eubacterium sp.]|nr:DNA repair protein [Eubacterium sp.]